MASKLKVHKYTNNDQAGVLCSRYGIKTTRKNKLVDCGFCKKAIKKGKT